MPPFLRPHILPTLAATLALALPAAAQQADVRLPSLGSSADSVISPQEAEQYGAEFLGELRAAHLVLDDPQVDQYLQTLGYRLASVSSDPGQHYTFTLINVPQINSFATFGGYVFIFSGMVTATQSQDELAAVMAHELAHISQQHLQRAVEDQKKSLPLYVLGTLAAAVAASRMDDSRRGATTAPYGYGYGNNTPYDGGVDPVQGVIAAGLGMMAQHQIEFTRKDEEEADHVGIETLAKAGFDPEAMANVFAHMQALTRPGGNGGMAAGNAPDFLQDHPVSSVRIADARARARVLDRQMKSRKAEVAGDPPGRGLLPLPFVKSTAALLGDPAQGPSELQYQLMRERIRVLSAVNPRDTLDYYRRSMAGSRKFAANTANRYGYALALVQLGDADKAVQVMESLVEARPRDLTLALGLADAERRAGRRNEALQRYASLNAMWPNVSAIVLDYSRALLSDGSKTGAKVAQGLLKPLLDDDSEPALYETYGHACHVAGDDVHAGIAYADATYLSGRAADALDQLHRLLDRKDLDYYTRAQIDARIAQITPIVLEIRRRHLDRGDNYDNQLQGGGLRTGLRFGACAGIECRQR
ncbi:MAG: M48 family metalloprotease [Rhodanobacteraceae bacterium]